MIGGRAPSEYVSRVQNSAEITEEQLNDHMRSHLIDPELLRADNFTAFFERRQTQLLQRIGAAMGKSIEVATVPEAYELVTEYEVDEVFEVEGEAHVPA